MGSGLPACVAKPHVLSPMLVLTSTPAEQVPKVHAVAVDPGLYWHFGCTGPQIRVRRSSGGSVQAQVQLEIPTL